MYTVGPTIVCIFNILVCHIVNIVIILIFKGVGAGCLALKWGRVRNRFPSSGGRGDLFKFKFAEFVVENQEIEGNRSSLLNK